MFENAGTDYENNGLKGKSDMQKQVNRLLSMAFKDEPRLISPEVPVSLFKVDMILDLKQRNLFNLALEVSDPVTKNFRTEYPTPGHRIRERFLIKKGYIPIEIDTNSFPNYDQLGDEEKAALLRDHILDRAYLLTK